MIKRKSIEHIKLNTDYPLVGMEVGVYKGENALNILQNLNIQKLYLIDPYLPYPDYNPHDLPMPLDLAKRIAYETTKNFPVDYLYKKFVNCTDDDFSNQLFDFIYIDGEHSEEAFRNDFDRALGLLKSKSFLCGHDANFPQIRGVLDFLPFRSDKVFPDPRILQNPFGEGWDWLIEFNYDK